MKSITVQAEVTSDQVLKIEIPCDIPPGQVEVVLTIRPDRSNSSSEGFDWGHLRGLGREVWQDVDANKYLRDIRD